MGHTMVNYIKSYETKDSLKELVQLKKIKTILDIETDI